MPGYILWHNDTTHETQFWFMNKERLARRGTALFETGQAALVGPPFRIVGTHNGHILWHHDTTHETQFWFMNNEHIVRRATVMDESGQAIFIGPPFHIVGVADFNGDGNSDILWYNDTTHETQIWFMNQERLVRRGTLFETGQAALIGPPFRIVGTSDSDVNGKAEIIWHHDTTHETQFWSMDSERIARRGTVLDESGQAIFIAPPFRVVGGGVIAPAARDLIAGSPVRAIRLVRDPDGVTVFSDNTLFSSPNLCGLVLRPAPGVTLVGPLFVTYGYFNFSLTASLGA